MNELVDKFQCTSLNNEGSDEEMREERVFSIQEIVPDNFNVFRTPRTQINKKSNLREIISSQIKQPESADTTLRFGGEIFKVPIIILQTYSKFFQNFPANEKIIDLTSEISGDIFHKIYAWMLSPSKVVGRENLILMLMGAQVKKTNFLMCF